MISNINLFNLISSPTNFRFSSNCLIPSITILATQILSGLLQTASAQGLNQARCLTGTCENEFSLQSYESALNPLLKPDREKSLNKFPQNLANYFLTEYGLTKEGDKGCKISRGLAAMKDCSKASAVKGRLLDEIYAGDLEDVKSLDSVLHIDPQKSLNGRAAYKIGEEQLLQNSTFFDGSETDLIHFFKTVHRSFSKDLSENTPFAQNFRTISKFVFKKSLLGNPEKIISIISEKNFSNEELLILLESTLKGMESLVETLKDGRFETELKLTSEEQEVWKKFSYLSSDPKEIEDLMFNFTEKLKLHIKQNTHPVALAAWAHCEFVRIHPFQNGNGRIARLLLNALLVRGGYNPVVFPDDVAYVKAIEKDTANPGEFARYLSSILIPWNRNQQKKFPIK